MTSEEARLQEYFYKNYSLNCPPSTYLESYDFFALCLHILSPFSAILGVYAILVVVFGTPKSMESAKWFILHLHVTTFTIEVVINILLVPFLFLPSGAIYSTGVLMKLGFPFKPIHIIGQQSFTVYSIAILMLFENRHSQITSIKYRMTRKRTKIIFYALHYLIAIPIMLTPHFESFDSNSEKLKILEKIPCPEIHFFQETTQVLLLNVQLAYKSESMLTCYFTVISNFFSLQSGYYLIKRPNMNISEKTRNLQKRFFNLLVIQLFIPFAVLVAPLFLFFMTLANGIVQQSLNSLIIIAFSIHGLVSSISLILLHKPYRTFTWDMTIGLFWHPTEKPSRNNSFRPTIIATL